MATVSRKRKILDLTDDGGITEIVETLTDDEGEPHADVDDTVSDPIAMKNDAMRVTAVNEGELRINEPPSKRQKIEKSASNKKKATKRSGTPALKDIERELTKTRREWMKQVEKRKEHIAKLKQKYYEGKAKYDEKTAEKERKVRSLVIEIQKHVDRRYCTQCFLEKALEHDTLKRKVNRGTVCQGHNQRSITSE